MAKRKQRDSIVKIDGVARSFPLGQDGGQESGLLEVLKGITLEIFGTEPHYLEHSRDMVRRWWEEPLRP